MYGNGRIRARFARHCAKVFTFTFKSFAASSAVNKRSTVYAPSTIPSDQSLPADLAIWLRPTLHVEFRFRSETGSATPKNHAPPEACTPAVPICSAIVPLPHLAPIPRSLAYLMARSESVSSLPHAYSMMTSETFQSAPPDSWTVPAGMALPRKSL
jgi:hypothetical protein